jgi:hypothetical protein
MADELFTADSQQSAVDLASLLREADKNATVEILFQPPSTYVVRKRTDGGAPSPLPPPLGGIQGPKPTPPIPPLAPASGGFVDRRLSIAKNEWDFFGRQTYDPNGHALQIGHKEGEEGYYQRVGQYWVEGTGTHGVDGRDHDMPWSAAFISWNMRNAGAHDRFRYSTLRSTYIYQSIRDRANGRQEAGYWCWRLNELRPSPGDLVCWARQSGVDYDHQANSTYAGHCDVVVECASDKIFVIGGNVGDSVTKRPLKLNTDGFLPPTVQGAETVFALMQNRIV